LSFSKHCDIFSAAVRCEPSAFILYNSPQSLRFSTCAATKTSQATEAFLMNIQHARAEKANKSKPENGGVQKEFTKYIASPDAKIQEPNFIK